MSERSSSSRLPELAVAAFQIGDAVACAAPADFITEALDRVECPPELRRVLPGLKVAAGLGLILGTRSPRLALITATALVAYFLFAIAAHIRVKDTAENSVAAVFMLGVSTWLAKRAYARFTFSDHPVTSD
ncbi:MAG: DoxX family protein [Acidimicrobiia bacterium]|nr:DoxX family protein [Acidimicrobiia bacterium]